MTVYRTARGKSLDMAALTASNERARAVSNMPVNARGDTIDSVGKITVPLGKKVTERYQNTVSDRASNIVSRKAETPAPSELLPHEAEFEQEDADTADIIAAIKEQESSAIPEFVVKSADEAPDFFEPEPVQPAKTVRKTK